MSRRTSDGPCSAISCTYLRPSKKYTSNINSQMENFLKETLTCFKSARFLKSFTFADKDAHFIFLWVIFYLMPIILSIWIVTSTVSLYRWRSKPSNTFTTAVYPCSLFSKLFDMAVVPYFPTVKVSTSKQWI
jgi:hypothetical protein